MQAIRDPSEDMIDTTLREHLENNDYRIAYYSPPHGSWSIIDMKIGGSEYRTYSERDKRRPDMVAYRWTGGKLYIIAVESKEAVTAFTRRSTPKRIESMRGYTEELLRRRYRHRRNNKWKDWNKRIEEMQSCEKVFGYCLAAGEEFGSQESSRFSEYLKGVVERCADDEVLGVLVSVDWSNLVAFMRVVLNPNSELQKVFPNGKRIEIRYGV
jgi:hypothetical protein